MRGGPNANRSRPASPRPRCSGALGRADHLQHRASAADETPPDLSQRLPPLIVDPVEGVEGDHDVEVVVERQRQHVVDVELDAQHVERHPGQGTLDHPVRGVDPPDHRAVGQSFGQQHRDEAVPPTSDVEESLARHLQARGR